MNGRVHTREFKLAIARQLASGERRPAQICREHNLASSVVSRWRNEYQSAQSLSQLRQKLRNWSAFVDN